MPSLSDPLIGFEADHRDLPCPPVDVTGETREKLVEVIAAIARGATPEEITDFLDDGFPGHWTQLDEPLVREEHDAHLDILLTVLQSPADA